VANRQILYPGDRTNFVEGWFDLRRPVNITDTDYLAVQSLCRITDLANQANEHLGHSYRGFKVGAAVLALDEPGRRAGIYFGGNLTPYKGAPWNCAEKRAFEVVQERGFNRILALAVSGPPQIDASGVESPTLHPCHKCRTMMNESDMTDPNVLVATTNLDQTAHELFTLDSLIRRHDTKQPQPFPDYHSLLPFYWQQVLEFDPKKEKEEHAILEDMRKKAG
jgi:cytidine deaminase